MIETDILKTLENDLAAAALKLKEDLSAVRSNRPSVEVVENIKVDCYEQTFSIKQLATINLVPPREIQVSVWDKSVAGPVAKAIEDARVGLSVTNDGGTIRATLSPLGEERRAELTKLVKKTGEETRIRIRSLRDEANKKSKYSQDSGELSEDASFKLREKVQKAVDKYNSEVERLAESKLAELGE